MKIPFLKVKHWLLLMVAGVLGIPVGCEMAVEYGAPYADFEVKGTVTNEAGDPIQGIVVSHPTYSDELGMHQAPVDTTDQQGRYQYSSWTDWIDGTVVELTFSDVDSTENGHYRDTTLHIPLRGASLSGGHGWYEGHAVVEQNVTLSEM